MKKFLVIASVLIVAAACAAPPTNREGPGTSANRAAEPTPVAAVSEAELAEKEKAVWETLKRKDYGAFANMLASDYVEVGTDGAHDKSAIVTILKDLDLTDVSFANWRLVPIDKDAAILIYEVTVKAKFKGKEIPPGPYHAASAWVNRDDKWQAVYYQETLAEKSPPPSSSPAPATSTSPATRAGEVKIPEDPVEREKMVWDTLKRKDYDAFASFLDEGQVEVEPHGVYDKAGTLKNVRMFDASKAELSDFKTVKFDPDAELVTYLVTLAGARPEKERATTIWVNRGGKWLALFHEGTRVPSPAASPSPAMK